MVARAHTFTIDGLHARAVTVEVDIRTGLPAFAIVGLADAPVREARERVQAAIRNSGYEFPGRIDAKTFEAYLPFRRFNRNWYRALAGGALLANSEIAGGMYVFGVVGGDYTVVCKNLNYTFLRPCFGPKDERPAHRCHLARASARITSQETPSAGFASAAAIRRSSSARCAGVNGCRSMSAATLCHNSCARPFASSTGCAAARSRPRSASCD